jgi:hypothetical protein
MQRTFPRAAVLTAVFVLSSASLAVPATAQEQHKRVEEAVRKGVKYLLDQQKDTVLLLIGTAGDYKVEEVAADWKDVTPVPGTTDLKVKGKVYREVYAALPPGWFAPEPVLGLRRKQCDQVGGHTAMVTLALLAAGVSPKSEPKLAKALDCLGLMLGEHVKPGTKGKPKPSDVFLAPGPSGTYALAMRAAALEYALRRLTGTDPRRRMLYAALEHDGKTLAGGHSLNGGWTYTMRDPSRKNHWDLSCTQYAVLGLWAAARGNVEMSDKIWKHVEGLLIQYQLKDGGWSYFPDEGKDEGDDSKVTMTQAGIATLFVIMDLLHTRTRGSGRPDITPFSADLLKTLAAADKALESFGRVYEPKPNDGYYMYGTERIGVAGGFKRFGAHDWFKQGAEAILAEQRDDGSWKGRHPAGPTGGTAWNILFLVYGSAPVVINKLQYGPKGDWVWHNYPRDAANLCAWWDRTYEAHVNWQIVSLSPETENDLYDAPVLYVGGHKPVTFTPDEVKMLRRYVERGGTLLFQANGADKPFADSVLKLGAELYPPAEFPERQFTDVPSDHPLYTISADGKKANPVAKIKAWHMSDGVRSFAILVPDDIAHVWHGNKPNYRPECFTFFGNLMTYVTDRAPLQPRLRPAITEGEPAGKGGGAVKLATVAYTSAGSVPLQSGPGKGKPAPVAVKGDWALSRGAWAAYEPWFKHVTGVDLSVTPGVKLTDGPLSDYHVLHLSGRHAFKLDADEKKALKAYIEGGGTLFLDPAGGQGGDFVTSCNALLRELFPDKLKQMPTSSPVISGQGGLRNLGNGNISRAARLARPGYAGPSELLKVVELDGRPAVVMAIVDVTFGLADGRAFERQGFAAKTARELAANVLLIAKGGK